MDKDVSSLVLNDMQTFRLGVLMITLILKLNTGVMLILQIR